MDSSQQERDRMKEEYKDHFRKMRDTRERVKEAVRYQNITKAVTDMNADKIFDSMGEMVDALKDKIALAEAKLDIALESYTEVEKEPQPAAPKPGDAVTPEARKALQQIRLEMGLVYSELEKEAQSLRQQQKTMGRATEVTDGSDDAVMPATSKKTIGKAPQ